MSRIKQLIHTLQALPGVGPRSAQRMTYHLLQHKRQAGLALAQALEQAMTDVVHCERCRNFSETPICDLCLNPKRDASTICVVESPADVLAIEQTGSFRGLYFVLMGHLSPLDGIGPNELGIDVLTKQWNQHPPSEVILATNSTLEGETTAQFLAQLCQKLSIPCSRIAHGIPMGGELEYLDGHTVAHAFSARLTVEPPTHQAAEE